MHSKIYIVRETQRNAEGINVGSSGKERQKKRVTLKYTKACQMENGLYMFCMVPNGRKW